MATMKLLSSKDDQATANFMLTLSGRTLMLMKDTGEEPVTPDNYLTKEKLYDSIAKGDLSGNLKEKTGEMYDHMVVELGTNKDYALKASEVILNRFKNPNLQFVKNQGGGRVQVKNITGQKEIMYELHQENNGEMHLHILVSRYAIDGKTVNPQDSQKDKYVRQTYLDKINEDLAIQGLKPLSDFTTSITPSNSALPKASITTQNEAKDVINSEDTNKAIEAIDYQNVSISDTVIDDTLAKAEKDLAQLIETAKKKAEEIKQIKAAQTVLSQNEALKYNNAQLVEKLNEAHNAFEVAKELLEQKDSKLKTALNEVNLVRDTFQLPDELPIVEAISTKLQEKEDDYQAIIEEKIELETSFKNELQNKSEEIAEKEVFIEALAEENKSLQNVKTENGLLKSTIEQKDSVISTKDTQLEIEKKYRSETELKYAQLEERFNEVLASSKSQEEANRKLLEQNTRMLDSIESLKNSNQELSSDNDKLRKSNNNLTEIGETLKGQLEVKDNEIENLTKELANKDKAINVLTELYTEVKNKLASTTARLKASLTKLANGEVKNTINKVVKDNNSFAQQLKAIDEDTADKTAKIEALRKASEDRAKADKEEINKEKDNLKVNKPK
jgi:DNA repair exonuclease SbcCD ATPase subunit